MVIRIALALWFLIALVKPETGFWTVICLSAGYIVEELKVLTCKVKLLRD